MPPQYPYSTTANVYPLPTPKAYQQPSGRPVSGPEGGNMYGSTTKVSGTSGGSSRTQLIAPATSSHGNTTASTQQPTAVDQLAKFEDRPINGAQFFALCIGVLVVCLLMTMLETIQKWLGLKEAETLEGLRTPSPPPPTGLMPMPRPRPMPPHPGMYGPYPPPMYPPMPYPGQMPPVHLQPLPPPEMPTIVVLPPPQKPVTRENKLPHRPGSDRMIDG